jgi:hypothetical protein
VACPMPRGRRSTRRCRASHQGSTRSAAGLPSELAGLVEAGVHVGLAPA